MRQLFWIPGLAILLTTAHAGEVCLRYAPTNVTLSGKLVRLIFAGRPNYESVESGDEPEVGYYLELTHAVCTEASPNTYDSAQKNVKLVQLVLDSKGYSTLRSSLGSNVTLSGKLFSAITGHHHAPLLLQDIKFR
jgi:hypothetical protein